MSDTLLENVSALVGEMQGLARQAHAQYVVEVDGVIAARSRGTRHIERLLDGILDFGYIDISAVSSQRVDSAQVQRNQFAAAPSRARRVLNHGDVLLSTVRPGLKAHARITHNLGLPLVGSTGFAALRPHIESDSSFIFHSRKTPGLSVGS